MAQCSVWACIGLPLSLLEYLYTALDQDYVNERADVSCQWDVSGSESIIIIESDWSIPNKQDLFIDAGWGQNKIIVGLELPTASLKYPQLLKLISKK